MEVTNVPNLAAQKADESQKVKVPAKSASAYAAAKDADKADISSKARQLLSLREAYKKLDDKAEKLDAVQESQDRGVQELSSEEIVDSILKGTLFEVV